jgi:hypothetical protein
MNAQTLTDANRLAYTIPHEAQGPSGCSSRTQGRPCPAQENDCRGTDQDCTPSSECPLDQEGGKERVPLRRRYMTRNTFQKGYVFARMTEHGKVHVIRYRVRSTDGKWRHKAETVNSPRCKDAERILAERLREVNRGLRFRLKSALRSLPRITGRHTLRRISNLQLKRRTALT